MQINSLKLVPNWRFEDVNGRSLHAQLLPLLAALQKRRKLTAAAQDCELSYRLAWNILQDAEEFFGSAVAVKERGRGASLTPLGQELLQANQRIDARLHPQMESLEMELNANVHRVLADHVRVLRIYASHGYAVALIPKHLSDYQTELHYHGSEDALKALRAGSCKIAGFTVPLHHKIASQQARYRNLLGENEVHILRFIKRQQGLMVAPGNPFNLQSLNDLSGRAVRLINRQPYSGTRELFDQLLSEEGVNAESIKGYDQYEYTHTAVAAQVATGMADVGFGMQAAAARFDLEFLPLTEDAYLWAVNSKTLQDLEVRAFIEMLSSVDFQSEVNSLPGYQCDLSGESVNLSELLL